MKTVKARGVVLREYEAGESDKRLVLLCKGLGRLTAYARGARKPKSKFMAAAQMFTYGDFILTEGRGFHSLAQAEVIENFYGIRNDYTRFCHGQYVAEVCEKTVLENTACDDLLLLLLKTLSHLSRGIIAAEQVAAVFLLRFYLFYGLAPEVSECAVCGGELPQEANVFFGDEGMLCQRCAGGTPRRMSFSRAAMAAARYILEMDTGKSFMFNVNDSVLSELKRANKLIWAGHFDVTPQSEELL